MEKSEGASHLFRCMFQNSRDTEGILRNTPYLYACHVDEMGYDFFGSTRRTAASRDQQLIHAATDGNLHEVRNLLLQKGINVNATDENANTALLGASKNGKLDDVVELLKHDEVDVNHQNKDGWTALILASSKGCPQMVAHLVGRKRNKSNNGHSEIVGALLNHDKVDVNLHDKHWNTALMFASNQGHADIVAQLLKHDKMDVNHQNNLGHTALIEACIECRSECVKHLLEHNEIDISRMAKNGFTAYKWAMKKPHPGIEECLKEYLAKTPRPNVKGSDGEYSQNCSQREVETKQRFDTKEQAPRPHAPMRDVSLIRAALDGSQKPVRDRTQKATSIIVSDTGAEIAHCKASSNDKSGITGKQARNKNHKENLRREDEHAQNGPRLEQNEKQRYETLEPQHPRESLRSSMASPASDPVEHPRTLVCDAAIPCLTRTTEERMTTKALLPKLSEATHTNPKGEVTLCGACFRNMPNIKCSEGHELCRNCIESEILRDGLSGGRQLRCPVDGCSSHPFSSDYLFGRISPQVYNNYIVNRDRDDKLDKFGRELNRNTALLASLASESFQECPHLFWITPVEVGSCNPIEKWLKKATIQKYSVVFICAHSHQPGHDPFEMEISRKWIVKFAPWLKLCLKVLTLTATFLGAPLSISRFEYEEKCKKTKAFLDHVDEQGSAVCDSILEQGTISIEMCRQVQQITDDAFQFIAEKAKKEAKIWKSKMVPVRNENGHIIWVKNEYQSEYFISTDSA